MKHWYTSGEYVEADGAVMLTLLKTLRAQTASCMAHGKSVEEEQKRGQG